ncbi:MAG: ABC transporter permease [Chloroflexota bacterium]
MANTEVKHISQPTHGDDRQTLKHIRIQPATTWFPIDFGEIWAFRDLFAILAMRDIKLRYKQTMLGIIWVILQPLVASLIFAVIFGRIAALPSDGKPYLLFIYAGMLPWNLFAGCLQRAGNSLISDAKLITKVYFPRLIIPIASSAAVLLDFAVAFVVMIVLLFVYHDQVSVTWNILALPLLLLVVLLISIGVSLFLSALNVYYRDFMYALPFVIQVWMYASPLVYSASMIPDRWRVIYALNPMAGVIDGFRWALLGTGEFPLLTMSIAVVMGCLFFIVGAYIFQRVESSFADVV